MLIINVFYNNNGFYTSNKTLAKSHCSKCKITRLFSNNAKMVSKIVVSLDSVDDGFLEDPPSILMTLHLYPESFAPTQASFYILNPYLLFRSPSSAGPENHLFGPVLPI